MKRYCYVRETSSTNVLMKEKLRETALPEGFVVRADFQHAGKGQGANRWESVKGKNLLFSLLLYPSHIPVEEQFLVSQIVSVGILRALKQSVADDTVRNGFSLKWPNDIYWNEQKIGGILIENSWQGGVIASSVIGAGLNINQKVFLSDAPNPVSLLQITGKRFRRKKILDLIMSEIADCYVNKTAGQIRREYINSLFRKTGHYRFQAGDELFSACIESVEKDGKLILKRDNGQVSGFYFKEVGFVL